jgi:Ca2+/Na+ antiporter
MRTNGPPKSGKIMVTLIVVMAGALAVFDALTVYPRSIVPVLIALPVLLLLPLLFSAGRHLLFVSSFLGLLLYAPVALYLYKEGRPINENAARGVLRAAYNQQQHTYDTTRAYASTWQEAGGLLGATVAGERMSYSGYIFRLSTAPDRSSFIIIARPERYCGTGRQSFYLDETGNVRSTRENRDPSLADPIVARLG